MAKLLKLTEEDLAHGRQLMVLAFEGGKPNQETFYRWLDDNIHGLTLPAVRETYDKLFATGNKRRGYKLSEAMLKDYDPVGIATKGLVILAVTLVFFGGALGGFVYLLKLVFN